MLDIDLNITPSKLSELTKKLNICWNY